MTSLSHRARPALEVHRVLPLEPYGSLEDYQLAGGGAGVVAAEKVEPSVLIDELEASGLRGRGGAGFPTGTKWRSVLDHASTEIATTVIVNAAEGEPGTSKDRAILQRNPYAVIEGALIAARVVRATSVVIATKERFHDLLGPLRAAIAEVESAGWSDGITISIVEGPSEYLYGEETALLEVLDGRPPFPRIAPPYRRGVTEVVQDDAPTDGDSGLAADVVMATTDDDNVVPPVLVNNVETFANVALVVTKGADWFRTVGTHDSPGTIVCTVTGAVAKPGVFEVAMGTQLDELIELAGGPADEDHRTMIVLAGVSSAPLTADRLDVPLTHEAMRAAGSGLGSAGFIVVADDVNPVAVAAGASRFLAVESCGQCTPCKQDGLVISTALRSLCDGTAEDDDLTLIHAKLTTITDGARCSLAEQHRTVVQRLVEAFPGSFEARLDVPATALAPFSVSDDERFDSKQPDWTYDEIDSGQSPADRRA